MLSLLLGLGVASATPRVRLGTVLVSRRERPDNLQTLLGVVVLPGLKAHRVHEVRPSAVGLDDGPLGGRQLWLWCCLLVK